MSRHPVVSWYAVRCVFRFSEPQYVAGYPFEERITLWRATSADQAIERAEAEALEYAENLDESTETYLGLAQSYKLADEPGDGAEVFSLIRMSRLEPSKYLDTFFDTGTERQQHWSAEIDPCSR